MQKEIMKQMAARIKSIRAEAEALKALSPEIPAVERNTERILASVRMLEVNVSDLLD